MYASMIVVLFGDRGVATKRREYMEIAESILTAAKCRACERVRVRVKTLITLTSPQKKTGEKQ